MRWLKNRGFFGGYGGGFGFGGSYRYGSGYTGNNFAIIVVLFILLVIVGCSCFKGDY
ncbi:sporulation protein YjcZ [Priestia megaterium]|uniref:YjcZ family sporulation protein n=1 Tax=Priestia megaterium TaxID=1404 RepID=UPI000BFE377D|nr:YjcZ family sporulation protein [Priestia megaterium]PGK30368.1 sporulation protein YjcZ [Priestia megaterium]